MAPAEAALLDVWLSVAALAAVPLALLAGMLASSEGYYGEGDGCCSDAHAVRRKVLGIQSAVALALGPMYTGFFLAFDAPWAAVGPAIFTVTTTVSHLLVRAGRYRAAAVLLSWSIWFCPEWCVVYTDQLYSPLMIWMAPSAFMAGPLLGRTAAAYAGIASVVFVAVMGAVPHEVFGVAEMTTGFGRPLLHVLCGTTAIGLIAFYSWSTTGSYDDARAVLEAKNAELAEVSSALERGNKDMAKVLDNVHQGLVTVDEAGRIVGRSSAVVCRLLGRPEPGQTIWELVARVDPSYGACLELGWEALSFDWMSQEMALYQLPRHFTAGDCTFLLEVEPLDEGFLVVMSDISDQLARLRAESHQQQTMAVFRHFRRDRGGVVAFLEDTDRLVASLLDEDQDPTRLKRQLHTVKGNSGLFGLVDVAERCHALEDALAESGRLDRARAESLVGTWRALRANLDGLVDRDASGRVELEIETVQRLADRIADGTSPEQAAELVRCLAREPITVPLQRLGEQARGLAERLGKPDLQVSVAGNGIRTDRLRTGELFNTLVHVVRNAVDHGIEDADTRAAAGKPPGGRLRLEARQDHESLVVEIADDGAGIAWERIRQIARARGLPARTRSDLVEALFSDGLSTRERATRISGRGVGTAAVAQEIARLGGDIEVDSTPQVGTTFRFRLPPDAVRVHALA